VIDNLLYVSRAALPTRTCESELDDILAAARSRNRTLGVTGALIFTHDNFAQLLEGPPGALEKLMSSVQRDPRHTEVKIVGNEKNTTRRFADWDMAYGGSSVFIARHVRVLAASFAAPNHKHASRLMDLMVSLSGCRLGNGDAPDSRTDVRDDLV
jgi:hypothetical protein